jgi:6-phosphogluconate dehydrogenase
LLLDSKSIFADQLEAVEATSVSKGYDYTDLALLTDGLRSERLPAALIQGQRDFFGAHTYKRVDKDGTFHTLWSGDRTEVAV